MPENGLTLTGYKRRIREYADINGHDLGDSKISRLATKLCKRQARMLDEDLERIFMFSDPTPKKAFRNLSDSGHHLMRDIGPVPA